MQYIRILYVTLHSQRDNYTSLQHKNMVADYELIRKTRFHLGLTQKQLADRAEISLRTVSNAEGGKCITPAVNRAILSALGLK